MERFCEKLSILASWKTDPLTEILQYRRSNPVKLILDPEFSEFAQLDLDLNH